jgi:cell division protein FtsN
MKTLWRGSLVAEPMPVVDADLAKTRHLDGNRGCFNRNKACGYTRRTFFRESAMYSNPRLVQDQRGSTALGVLLGLLIGVAIAAGVALYINFGPKPFVNKPDVQASHPLQSAPGAPSSPVALPGKPGDQPVERPKYDFYKTLPSGQAASAPAATQSAVAAPERIFLQVGAYQNPSEADNLKARLAMLGIESNVQRIDLGDKGVFYRVRLGSFPNADAADTMRARLATEGIAASVVRSSPEKP